MYAAVPATMERSGFRRHTWSPTVIAAATYGLEVRHSTPAKEYTMRPAIITGETNAPNLSTHLGSGPLRAPKKRNGSKPSARLIWSASVKI